MSEEKEPEDEEPADEEPTEKVHLIRLVTPSGNEPKPQVLSSITEWLKVVGACIAVVAGSWAAVTGLRVALVQKDAAENEKKALTQQIDELKKQQQEIISLYEKTKGQAEAALAAVADLKKQAQDAVASQEQQDPKATVGKLQDALGALATLSESIDAGVASIAPAVPNLAPAINNKRVFLQINKDEQRPSAENVQTQLRNLGCIAPGIQNVGGRGFVPDQTEIRYFRYPEDHDVAKVILDHLAKTTGLKNARISYVSSDPSATRTGQIEIWFAKSYE